MDLRYSVEQKRRKWIKMLLLCWKRGKMMNFVPWVVDVREKILIEKNEEKAKIISGEERQTTAKIFWLREREWTKMLNMQ